MALKINIPSARIGNDIKIEFNVYRTNSESENIPEDFSDAQDISVELNERYGSTIVPQYEIAGNKITVLAKGEDQRKTGTYVLLLKYKKPNPERQPGLQPFVVDIPAFTLVSTSQETTAGTSSENMTVETIQLNGVVSVNQNGADGLSAFQIWSSQEGNEGKTETEFFEFLQKPAKDFVEGVSFGYESGKLQINY